MKKLRPLLFLCLLLALFACKKDEFKHDEALTYAENLQNLADLYTAKGLPGIVLITDNPETGLKTVASGFADLDNEIPMNKDYLFHSASLMKTYTATCIFLLQEQGLLNIEDKIDQHLPASLISKIPNGTEATIKSLLNHSSGVPDFATKDDYLEDLIAYVEGGPEPKDEFEYIKDDSPDFSVGKKHKYSNMGYHILALIVSEISGQSFAYFLQKEIIEELGLENTYYKGVPELPDLNRIPEYYIDWEDKGILENSSHLESKVSGLLEGLAGLLASPEDYYLFLKALLKEERLISRSSLSEMMEVSHNKDFGYGQGLEVILSKKYPDKYGHKGGTQSSFFYYPEKESFILSFINYSFNSGGSPFDKMAIVPDKIGENRNLIGEIELCMFD